MYSKRNAGEGSTFSYEFLKYFESSKIRKWLKHKQKPFTFYKARIHGRKGKQIYLLGVGAIGGYRAVVVGSWSPTLVTSQAVVSFRDESDSGCPVDSLKHYFIHCNKFRSWKSFAMCNILTLDLNFVQHQLLRSKQSFLNTVVTWHYLVSYSSSSEMFTPFRQTVTLIFPRCHLAASWVLHSFTYVNILDNVSERLRSATERAPG